MWISVFGSNIEDKFGRVLYNLISQFDIQSISFLIGLFE